MEVVEFIIKMVNEIGLCKIRDLFVGIVEWVNFLCICGFFVNVECLKLIFELDEIVIILVIMLKECVICILKIC